MSGGHFDYKQYEIGRIADDIEELIHTNDSEELDQWGCPMGSHYSPETINEFKMAVHFLRLAQIYTHRIDWLVSADDGEDSFHSRLNKELEDCIIKFEGEENGK